MNGGLPQCQTPPPPAAQSADALPAASSRDLLQAAASKLLLLLLQQLLLQASCCLLLLLLQLLLQASCCSKLLLLLLLRCGHVSRAAPGAGVAAGRPHGRDLGGGAVFAEGAVNTCAPCARPARAPRAPAAPNNHYVLLTTSSADLPHAHTAPGSTTAGARAPRVRRGALGSAPRWDAARSHAFTRRAFLHAQCRCHDVSDRSHPDGDWFKSPSGWCAHHVGGCAAAVAVCRGLGAGRLLRGEVPVEGASYCAGVRRRRDAGAFRSVARRWRPVVTLVVRCGRARVQASCAPAWRRTTRR